VLAAVTTARRIDLAALMPRRAPQRKRDLALGLIIARLLAPAAKLATARMLDPASACHSLGEMLALGRVTAKEVYATLDWLDAEQPFIEATLARRHLKNGALLLTMLPPPTWRGGAARSPVMATAANTGATARSRSSACSVRRTAVPSRSRCSKATPPTR
jgi:hypothetical protein